MPLTKRAIEKFLDRKLDDCRPLKKLSRKELSRMKDELPARPPIWSRLKTHQQVCLLLGIKYKRFGFWMDTGTGKTLLSIALIRYFKLMGQTKPTLVLVPNRINRQEWKREIRKHSPKTSYIILTGSSQEKWETLRTTDKTIVISTYAGMQRMVCKLTAKKKGKGNHLKMEPRWAKKLGSMFGGLVMDESTTLQNRKSLAFRMCRQIAKNVDTVFPLSGTPFGKDPTSLWTQMYLVDGGVSLGPNLGLFRAAFFKEVPNFWSGFPTYTFDKKKKRDLHRALAHRSIRYPADSADLPKRVPIPKVVQLPQDAQTYYDRAKQQIIAAHGNFQEQKNAFMRMRQISSGFLGYKDDETGTKAQLAFTPNRKLEMLTSLLTEIVEGHKVVVFNEFIFSGDMIEKELKRLKIGYTRVYGKTKDSGAALERFVSDDKCRVFLLNNASGAFGLNLQIAKYAIFYESPISPLIRKQCERRVERQGSKHDVVFLIDLICAGTYDQDIIDSLAEGRNLFDAIVEGKGPRSLTAA